MNNYTEIIFCLIFILLIYSSKIEESEKRMYQYLGTQAVEQWRSDSCFFVYFFQKIELFLLYNSLCMNNRILT